MARQYGWNNTLIFAYEGTYGTAEASGEYYKLPFVSCDLGMDQALIEDDIMGLGRDPQAPTYDLKRVTGQVVVPLDLRNIGYWLKLAFGNPATSGTGPYTHIWTSGGTSLPSACIEIAHPSVPAYFMNTGVRCESIAFSVSRTAPPTATLQLVGRGEAKATSATDADPNTLAVVRFDAFEGVINRSGSALSNVVSADLSYSNNLEVVETLRADALIEAAEPGMSALTGSITSRFGATTLYDDAIAQSGLDIQMKYTSGAHSLTLEAQKAYLPVSKRNISGPGGVEFTSDFQGADDSSEGEMFEVTLVTPDTGTYINA